MFWSNVCGFVLCWLFLLGIKQMKEILDKFVSLTFIDIFQKNTVNLAVVLFVMEYVLHFNASLFIFLFFYLSTILVQSVYGC